MIARSGKYFLYRHVRADLNEVFYVGIGTKRRLSGATPRVYERAFTHFNRTVWWHNIVNSCKYEVDILVESDDSDFIQKKEKEFILLYGRKDLNTGTLINLTDGGKSDCRKSKLSIEAALSTKRAKGIKGDGRHFKNWMNSSDYKNPKAKEIFMYEYPSGVFLKKFNSIVDCQRHFSLKGGMASTIAQVCNKKRVFRSKYFFSWDNVGDNINLSHLDVRELFFQPVQMICPKKGEILMEFSKMKDAAEYIGTSVKNVSDAIHRNHKCGGFIWQKKFKQQAQA